MEVTAFLQVVPLFKQRTCVTFGRRPCRGSALAVHAGLSFRSLPVLGLMFFVLLKCHVAPAQPHCCTPFLPMRGACRPWAPWRELRAVGGPLSLLKLVTVPSLKEVLSVSLLATPTLQTTEWGDILGAAPGGRGCHTFYCPLPSGTSDQMWE